MNDKVFNYIAIIAASLFIMVLSSCVHEYPEIKPEIETTCRIHLDYSSDMTEWHHVYDGENIVEKGVGETKELRQEKGVIRYVVRAYPVAKSMYSSESGAEYVLYKDLSEGYEHDLELTLPPGDYNIMVWSDIKESDDSSGYHDVTDFADIYLTGDHAGNTDYRDAFRGSVTVSVSPKESMDVTISMERPLAKYELICTDLEEFLDKEYDRIISRYSVAGVVPPTRDEALKDYKVVFYYVGYMPSAYSLYADKPVDSSVGVKFESSLKALDEGEASMGFDYVFINHKESVITLQVGLYSPEGEKVAMTKSLVIPIKRSNHTIVRGEFLKSNSDGGMMIDPDYAGDHNIIFGSSR